MEPSSPPTPRRPSARRGAPLVRALAATALALAAGWAQATPAAALQAQGEATADARTAVEALEPLREAAAEAGAAELAPGPWAAAEESASSARAALGRGDGEGAVEEARRAVELYRTAEGEALRARLLAAADTARERAREADAPERAPRSFARGDSLLAAAANALQARPRRVEEAERLAAEARASFLESREGAVLADSLRRGGLRAEDLRAREAERLERLARALDLGLEPGADPEERVRRIATKIGELRAALAATRDSLRDARSRAERLAGTADSLREALAGEEERSAELATRIEERQRHERRLREATAIFGPEEAEVQVTSERILLRLTGLTFPTGEAEVLPEHQAILTKVRRVLREFPDAPVRVEGHTDAQGDAERNRILSRQRALAVREYLLRTMPISADRIDAVGRGESEPVASNETAEGRESNRRIDVILDIRDLAPGG